MTLSLQQLAAKLGLEFHGDPELQINSVASLVSAASGDLCFVQERKYLAALVASRCSAVILPTDLVTEAGQRACLLSDEPYYHFIHAIRLLGLDKPKLPDTVDDTALISPTASLGEGVAIGPGAIIGDATEIGAGTSIAAGCVVEPGVRIGDDCVIHAGAVLRDSVKLGNRCVLQPGVVIGSDGFGLVMHDDQWVRIPHLGGVTIEDDVEIGANTTIDRGALDDTVIEQGCKLDNQIQVAHNVRIGAHTAIAACVGIAGSATIGRYCKISGAVVVLGHLTIADHVTITAMSLVTKDIRQAGVYSSGTPLLENSQWHRNNVRYKSLDKLAQTVARLDKKSGQS